MIEVKFFKLSGPVKNLKRRPLSDATAFTDSMFVQPQIMWFPWLATSDIYKGQAGCFTCYAGIYSNEIETGYLYCEACPPGTYSDVTYPSCVDCNPGYYSPKNGSVDCTACASGNYSSASGCTSCSVCGNMVTSSEGSAGCKPSIELWCIICAGLVIVFGGIGATMWLVVRRKNKRAEETHLIEIENIGHCFILGLISIPSFGLFQRPPEMTHMNLRIWSEMNHHIAGKEILSSLAPPLPEQSKAPGAAPVLPKSKFLITSMPQQNSSLPPARKRGSDTLTPLAQKKKLSRSNPLEEAGAPKMARIQKATSTPSTAEEKANNSGAR
ncbi:hypothetical protein Pelo_11992 [Pelomyxa schiedti]|nr:hypothetical protein Pelo_11992 [Pelomyxa schiedti]